MSYREWEEQEALKSKSKASTVHPSMPARRAIRAKAKAGAEPVRPVPRSSRSRGPESPPRPAGGLIYFSTPGSIAPVDLERMARALVAIGTHIEAKLTQIYAEQTTLLAYMRAKKLAEDWHGVQDAASDIRDIVAAREALLAVKAFFA